MAISNIGTYHIPNTSTAITAAATILGLCTISIDIINIHVATYYLTVVYVGIQTASVA